MKKLLTLLLTLFTLFSFGQSQLDFSQVNSVTQVGDQLVVKFQYFKDANLGEATLTQFDFQYNNKLLSYVSHEWQVSSTSAQKARNSWTGYSFTADSSKDATDYDGQYLSLGAGNASYATDADWSVERITVQDVDGYPTEAEFVKYTFTIKDKGVTNYTDYSDVIKANWTNFKESDGTLIDVTAGAAGQTLSLTDIKGGDAGNVAISVSSNVITNNIGDGSHFGYTIYLQSDVVNGIDQNTPVIASGNFDTAGDATVQGLENDTEYRVFIHVDSQQDYLDNAVTVSDLALIFAEAIGAGSTPGAPTSTFDYHLQSLVANVFGGQDGVNFQDSYEVLAHLQGVTSTNQVFISKTGNAYNMSGLKDTYGDSGNYFTQTITPTDNLKTFAFAHGLNGDVNFSHSYLPTSQNAVVTQATAKAFSINQSRYVAENRDIDLSSQIVDGDVVFTINSQVDGMVGSQFNIEYDRSKLVLSDVIFDTGNDMTNFANHIEENGKINIGSFDQNFTSTVKIGTPYKLVFTPIVQLDNTLGLITFKVKEGVKADGTQITFNIQ